MTGGRLREELWDQSQGWVCALETQDALSAQADPSPQAGRGSVGFNLSEPSGSAVLPGAQAARPRGSRLRGVAAVTPAGPRLRGQVLSVSCYLPDS